MSDHLSKQFDLELEPIRTRILQLGGLVERQLLTAIAAFSSTLEAMQQVIDTDREADAHEVGIDEACTLLIVRRQPTARDLRVVMVISPENVIYIVSGGDVRHPAATCKATQTS